MLPEPRVKALGGSAPPAIHLECKRGRDGSEETGQRTSSLRQVLAGPGTLSSSVCVASQGRHRVEVIRDGPELPVTQQVGTVAGPTVTDVQDHDSPATKNAGEPLC